MRFLAIVALSLVAIWFLEREFKSRSREEMNEDVLAQLRANKETAPSRRS